MDNTNFTKGGRPDPERTSELTQVQEQPWSSRDTFRPGFSRRSEQLLGDACNQPGFHRRPEQLKDKPPPWTAKRDRVAPAIF